MSAISLPPARTTILSYAISGGKVLITFATCRNLPPGRQITLVFLNLSSSMCFIRLVPTTNIRSGLWVLLLPLLLSREFDYFDTE